MHTITQKFHTIVDHPKFERRTFLVLVSLLSLFLSVYGFFLGKTVVAVVERRVAQLAIEDISTKMSILESEYLALSRDVNMNTAISLGFVESKQTAYVVRGVNGTAFALVP